MANIKKRKNALVNNKHWIKNWPTDERPRELLLSKGADFLSDAGLIAVLLRSGTRGKDAVALGRELISEFGGLRGLMHAKFTDLKKIKGLGPAKIAQLFAAIEIIKRQMKERIIGEKFVENDRDVMDYLSLSLQNRQEEFLKVIFLNKRNRILAVEELARGTINETIIYPREVVKRALELGAGALILVHNHPSGNAKPSQNDIDLTEQLVHSCQAINIAVLDHIIIFSGKHQSLKSSHSSIFN